MTDVPQGPLTYGAIEVRPNRRSNRERRPPGPERQKDVVYDIIGDLARMNQPHRESPERYVHRSVYGFEDRFITRPDLLDETSFRHVGRIDRSNIRNYT